jgi:hypothetical protein
MLEIIRGGGMRWAAITASALILGGCGAATEDSPTESWRDLKIHVESRSYGAVPGIRELLVFVNRGAELPAWDCRIDLRTSDADSWKQAIEDGRVGVYRRAAQVDQEHAVLQVRIRAEGSETVLHIPLIRKSAPPAGAGTAS